MNDTQFLLPLSQMIYRSLDEELDIIAEAYRQNWIWGVTQRISLIQRKNNVGASILTNSGIHRIEVGIVGPVILRNFIQIAQVWFLYFIIERVVYIVSRLEVSCSFWIFTSPCEIRLKLVLLFLQAAVIYKTIFYLLSLGLCLGLLVSYTEIVIHTLACTVHSY